MRKMAYSVNLNKKFVSNIQAEGSYQLPYHKLVFLTLEYFWTLLQKADHRLEKEQAATHAFVRVFYPTPYQGIVSVL